MSAETLKDYPFELTFNGPVNVAGSCNVAKDLNVSGTITGTGIGTDVLASNNTWSGTNQFTNDCAILNPDAWEGNKIATATDTDDALADTNTNFLTSEHTWTGVNTFAALPTGFSSGITNITNADALTTYEDMEAIINDQLSGGVADKNNIWTGDNAFNETSGANAPIAGAGLIPTDDNQAVTKDYVDLKVEGSSKTITYWFDTPGTYTISNIPFERCSSIDYWLYGAGEADGLTATTGSFISGSIGNVRGTNSLVIYVADNGVYPSDNPLPYPDDYPDPATLTPQNPSYIQVSGTIVATAGSGYYASAPEKDPIEVPGTATQPLQQVSGGCVEQGQSPAFEYFTNFTETGGYLFNAYQQGSRNFGGPGTKGGCYVVLNVDTTEPLYPQPGP